MEVIKSSWVAIVVTLLIGLLIGYLAFRPILKWLERRSLSKNQNHRAELFATIAKISPVFGAVLLLNFFDLFPFSFKLVWAMRMTLRVTNAFIVAFLVSEIFIFLYDRLYERRHGTVSSLFHILIRLGVYSVAIVTIAGILNYDVKAMLAALGVGGIAIALALQDTLSNLFGGIQILTSGQLRPGDYIRLTADVEGRVLDINWRNTTMRTPLDDIIIVPNSKISSSVTMNCSTINRWSQFAVIVGAEYDEDLEKVERVALEVAHTVMGRFPKVPSSSTPRIRFFEFADSSINFKVWLASLRYEMKYQITHEFIIELQKRFKEEEINIPFPIRTLDFPETLPTISAQNQ